MLNGDIGHVRPQTWVQRNRRVRLHDRRSRTANTDTATVTSNCSRQAAPTGHRSPATTRPSPESASRSRSTCSPTTSTPSATRCTWHPSAQDARRDQRRVGPDELPALKYDPPDAQVTTVHLSGGRPTGWHQPEDHRHGRGFGTRTHRTRRRTPTRTPSVCASAAGQISTSRPTTPIPTATT